MLHIKTAFAQSDDLSSVEVGGLWDAQTALTEMFDSNTVQVLQETGILEDYSKEVFGEFNELFASKKQGAIDFAKNNLKIPVPSLAFSWDHKSIRNKPQAEKAWTNLSALNIGSSVDIFNIPFNISLRGVLLNDEFNWNLSGVDLSFDQRTLLENIVNKNLKQQLAVDRQNPLDAIKSANIKSIFSERIPDPELLNNPFNSAGVDLLRNELKFKVLHFVMNHPKYREALASINEKKDSLQQIPTQKLANMKDSVGVLKDSLESRYEARKQSLATKADSVQGKVGEAGNRFGVSKAKAKELLSKKDELAEQVQNLETESVLKDLSKQYKGVWEERKRYYGDSLNNFKNQFLTGFSKNDVKRMSTDSLKRLAAKAGESSGFKGILQKINQFRLGRTNIDDHWFLSENLSLNGVMTEIESGNYTFAAAAGVQRFDYSIFPLLGFAIPNQLPDKQFLYGSAKYEIEDFATIKLSTLNSREKFNEFSSNIPIERNNNVFHIGAETGLTKQISLIGDFAYSRTNGVFIQVPEGESANDLGRSAGEVKLAYHIPKTNFIANVGYFYIGAQYLTLGNPFIRTGQKGLTFGLTGSLFNRLNLDFTVRKGKSLATENATYGRDDLTFQGSAMLNISKNLTFSASVFPNFTNFQVNELYSVESNLWATSMDLQYAIQKNKVKSINSLTYSNSVNELVLQDSVGLSNYDGLIYFGNVLFANGFGLDVLAMGWSEQGVFNGGLGTGSIQTNVLINKEKFNGNLGLLVGKEFKNSSEQSGEEMTYGITSGFNLVLIKKLQLGVNARIPLRQKTQNEFQNQQVFQEYISTKMSFNF